MYLRKNKMAQKDSFDSKSARSMALPDRTIPVGGTFTHRGGVYRVERRVEMDRAGLACIGCAFRSLNCPENYACSAFDRLDHLNVWFVRDEENL